MAKHVFVIVQEMDCDHGGGADVVAAYDNEEKAEKRIDELKQLQENNQRYFKYPTSWFIVELELNKDSRWE